MKNIYLVGFMGAGKTSVGLRLAEILHRGFIDLDQEIEKRAGRPIREIFQTEGEAHFRLLEQAELQSLSRQEGAIVALGGGAFASPDNRKIIEKTGISVWLDAPFALLFSRCAGDALRPLASSREEMEQLLERRRSTYEQATIRIEIDGYTVDEIADKIRAQLGTDAA